MYWELGTVCPEGEAVKWYQHTFRFLRSLVVCCTTQFNLNVQIYVSVGWGWSFDVWLRKMHVEGKRWEGIVNKIKKKSYRGSGIYVCFRCNDYKSDVPDSAALWQDAELYFTLFACFCQVLLEVAKQTEFVSARGFINYIVRVWNLVSRMKGRT